MTGPRRWRSIALLVLARSLGAPVAGVVSVNELPHPFAWAAFGLTGVSR